MALKKKYWVEIGGDRFDIDETRIAHWERFLTYAENHDFFKMYCSVFIKGGDTHKTYYI